MSTVTVDCREVESIVAFGWREVASYVALWRVGQEHEETEFVVRRRSVIAEGFVLVDAGCGLRLVD